MRLFIAVNFQNDIKDSLRDVQSKLRVNVIRGNFTLEDNLHLTIIFIGEVYGKTLDGIKKAMDASNIPVFELVLKDIGRFKRDRGDICWMGVSRNSALSELHSRLSENLSASDIKFDSRPYSPHLTLARECIFKEGFDMSGLSSEIPPLCSPVDKLSLMKSERVNGKLVYTEIYASILGV